MQKALTKHPTKPPIPSIKRTRTVQYNDRFVTSELTDMLTELRAHEEIKSLVHLFKDRPYSSARFSDWQRKYSANKSIREKQKKIKEILESRLVEQGLAGKSIPMTIFLLKNYYGYQDKREVEQETTHIFKVSRGATTPQLTGVAPPITIPNTPPNVETKT